MSTGSVIAGRYRVRGRLGVGGMSTVLLAIDERLERNVAVKLLAEHLADDPTFVSRFRREALAAARLVHPNIVQVFDSGFDADAHQHFIVMEYVPGQSCAELLRERGHLDVEDAVDIVSQACHGLDYAHRNGVVHRDVKPGNLLVSESGVVKLADFGIARATGQSSITQVGSVLGTAAYLSPEQARGGGGDPGRRPLLARRGQLSAAVRAVAVRGQLALGAGAQAAARGPDPIAAAQPACAGLALGGRGALDLGGPRGAAHTAIELSELILDGAHGISPWADEAPTRHLGVHEAATHVLPAAAREEAETIVAQPRPAARTPKTVPRAGRWTAARRRSARSAPRNTRSRRDDAGGPRAAWAGPWRCWRPW